MIMMQRRILRVSHMNVLQGHTTDLVVRHYNSTARPRRVRPSLGRRPRTIGSVLMTQPKEMTTCSTFSSITFPTTATASSSTAEPVSHKGPATISFEPKPWFDTRQSLDVRINELLNVETLHPADIVHPIMADLIRECCRSGHINNHNDNNSNSHVIAGLQRGQEILDRCLVEKRRYQMTTDLKLFVPQKLFQILLFGWCKIAHKETAAQARMKETLQLAIEEGKMDDAFLHTKLGIPRTARIASEVYPNVYLFNTYLIGLGSAAKMTPQAALDSEAILHDMMEYHRAMGWHTKPNTRSYTHVILAYANTRHVAAGRRAHQILQTIKEVHAAEKEAYEERYQQPYNYINPHENKRQIVTLDAAVYTATLKALQISNRSPEMVRELLNEAAMAPGVVLDAILFVVAIKSLSSLIDHENNALRRIALAREAETILRTMIQYSTTKGFQRMGPTRATDPVLEQEVMEESRHISWLDSDDPVDANIFDPVAHDDTATDSETSTPTMTLDEPRLSTDVNDQSKPTNASSGSETGLPAPPPHPPPQSEKDNRKSLQIGYNACIHAWAQSFCREGALECERLLQEMLDSTHVQPDTASFNTCLFAWSKSHKFHSDAGRRAVELLNRQCDLSSSDQIGDDVQPDFQTFTSCILVQSKSSENDRLKKALALLNKLLEEVKLGNLPVTRNPTAPFSAVLTTIANYKLPKTTESATTGEDESSEIDAFNSAIDTQSDPYSIAVNIFDQVERDAHGIGTTVDHHCVTAFLKCVVAHSVPGSTERESTTRRVFHDTCQAGQVSRQVLKEFHNILGRAASTVPEVRNPPKFWSRNVQSAFR